MNQSFQATRVWTPNDDPRQIRATASSITPQPISIPVPFHDAMPPVPVIARDAAPTAASQSGTVSQAPTSVTTIEVSKIKVTVAIEGAKLPTDILPEVGAPGSGKATVTLKVKAGGNELTATVKAKAYRDVLNKVQTAPHGAWAVLQGQLGAEGILEGAGFSVQLIVPKPCPEEAAPVPANT